MQLLKTKWEYNVRICMNKNEEKNIVTNIRHSGSSFKWNISRRRRIYNIWSYYYSWQVYRWPMIASEMGFCLKTQGHCWHFWLFGDGRAIRRKKHSIQQFMEFYLNECEHLNNSLKTFKWIYCEFWYNGTETEFICSCSKCT